METLTAKVTEDQLAEIQAYADEECGGNRSQAIRELLDRGVAYDDLEAELGATEARLKDLRRQLAEVRSHEDNVQELVEYVQEERSAEQRWREAGVLTRAKWRIVGMPSDES